MTWEVFITAAAEHDLQSVKEYIAEESGEERIAIEIMKKFYNKIKLSLMALWIAIISFSSKVFGQATADPRGSA